MLITIQHETRYRYDTPAAYTIQSLKQTPQNTSGQRILSWSVDCGVDKDVPAFVDSFGNLTHTLVINEDHDAVLIRVSGKVETTNMSGVVSGAREPFPLVAYFRETDLTRPNAPLADLAASVSGIRDRLEQAHALMGAVRDRIDYRDGETHVETTAAEALNHGYGVCQDHAHVFICCARLAGIPARYVSGYLQASENRDEVYEAGHAWAEAYIPDLGWVGFDVANRACPHEAYVRVAVGLDYRGAAPVRGLRLGGGAEKLDVSVQVVQESAQQQ